jgi:two-component system sensor histidine kinase TctE
MKPQGPNPAVGATPRRPSLRAQLLWGIGAPVLLAIVASAFVLYESALKAADTAYDRSLLASAKAIGESLRIEPQTRRLQADISYGALEAFEADTRSRMFYQVRGFDGAIVAGVPDMDLPPVLEQRSAYAALVSFQAWAYRGEPVRVATLLQPVADARGQGMATILVAETLELRRTLARQLLVQTLWQQALLLVLIAAVIVAVVQRATRPLRALSDHLAQRSETDLQAVPSTNAHREWLPLLEATNGFIGRIARLLEHQKRFVRDASHQLRTPLATLRVQVQSAQRGDVPHAQALREIEHTVQAATNLANQMLALAKVEQLRQQGAPQPVALDVTVRELALEMAPLIAEAGAEFSLHDETVWVRAHAWGLRELSRNLLHNALRHNPRGTPLSLSVAAQGDEAVLRVVDSGPGLSAAQAKHLFEPFAASGAQGGSGLGLAICHEIVLDAGGRITLRNRSAPHTGLIAEVRLPLAEGSSVPSSTGSRAPEAGGSGPSLAANSERRS